MEKSGFTVRKIGRHCKAKAAHLIVGCFLVIAIYSLLNTSYAPAAIVKPAHIEPPVPTVPTTSKTIDWTKKAYVQHVASPEELCKAVMLFSELHETFSSAQRVLYYPDSWSLDPDSTDPSGITPKSIARLLKRAAREFHVVLKPSDTHTSHDLFKGKFKKFLAFNLTEYDRVTILDTDSVVLKSMDELLLLPSAPVALPYVYWGESDGWQLSTKLMVIRPSLANFKQLETAVKSAKTRAKDVEIYLNLFNDTLIRLPQRPYHLLSQEFRRLSHSAYLDENEAWSAGVISREAKFIHFWDPPLNKPWAEPEKRIRRYLPRCKTMGGRIIKENCDDRDIWGHLYTAFHYRRRNVCGEEFL